MSGTNTDHYVDPGYVFDGYIWTPRLVAMESGASRLDLYGPSSRSGKVQVVQAEELSSGGTRFGFAPVAVIHSLSLDYTRMNATDRAALEAFWDAVDATATQFTYINADTGNTQPAWFDQPELSFEETYYNLYKVKLDILSLQTFFPLAGAAPGIGDADTILTRLFNPTTHGREKSQPRLLLSGGSFYVQNKSTITRIPRTLAMPRRTVAELANLISFFASACQGIRNTFQWTIDGALKTVRFSESTLEWKQSQLNTALFDVTVQVEEESAITVV